MLVGWFLCFDLFFLDWLLDVLIGCDVSVCVFGRFLRCDVFVVVWNLMVCFVCEGDLGFVRSVVQCGLIMCV